MKKEWIMPQASVDQFSTNEYLSTCWEVACKVDRANSFDRGKNGISHDLEHCGNPANQVLQDVDGDGFIDKMTEVGTDGLGNLKCTVFTSDSYRRERNMETIEPGDYIYWTTQAGSGRKKRVWHHQGYAQTISATNPNRS